MNLHSQLLQERSKRNALKMVAYIGDDKQRFRQLITLLLDRQPVISERASLVVNYCFDLYPDLIKPYLKPLIFLLKNQDSTAVKRNILRMLQNIHLPEGLMGTLTELCFQFLLSSSETVAVKVFAMTILHHICRSHPDLKNELRLIIENQLPYATAGFKSRGLKILKTFK